MDNLKEEVLEGDVQGTLITPPQDSSLGILLLHGSSGRPDIERARILATQGAKTLALRWFGGKGQIPGICEIPLETFFTAIEKLKSAGCKKIILIGMSKGAEAALLTSIHDSRVTAVIAISPTSVVWGNVGPGLDGIEWPQRSSWTIENRPLPFVALDPYWRRETRDGLVVYRSLYEQSLKRFAAEATAAAIPIEQTSADIVLVAGGDDALWPSENFAYLLNDRCAASGKKSTVIVHPDAGHRILLPGETKPLSITHAYGGSDAGDTALGLLTWNRIIEYYL